MSFGGAAAAMNAAIEQNAALRGKRKFLGDPVPKTGSKRIKGMHHTASDATRKTLRAKYETERHADQYREWLAVLLGLCLSALLLYLLL